jgi:hypothetical protein
MRRLFLITTVVLLGGMADEARGQAVGADREALIRSASSAAPASVAEHATIVDLQHNVLREGTNGIVCMPDDPAVPNDSPMCLDANWRELIDALMNRRMPHFQGIGIAYMLQGDMPVSNTDPYASEPTADNEWVADAGPHIMIIVSEPSLLESLPTDPDNGGPWVMWKGTSYAHIMVPVPALPK